MAIDFGINRFVMESGERYCIVVDSATGLPIFYPSLFLTTRHRNVSDAFATIESVASNLVVLLRFLESRKIDLEKRILTGDFLAINELDDLRDFAQKKRKRVGKALLENSMFSHEELDQSFDNVSNETQYARLTTFARYLSWLSKNLFNCSDSSVMSQIQEMERQIKERRPQKKSRNIDGKFNSLDDDQIQALMEVVRVGSPLNPFAESVQARNYLIISMLYHLGVRGGELLNIRIRDIDFGRNQIKIQRRADELDDPRISEPNAKTLDRTLPLGDVLIKDIHDYITQDRRKVPNSGRNDYLFVSHKEGPNIGRPISKAAYYKIFSAIRKASAKFWNLSGHKLRHSWNKNFSDEMDAKKSPPSERKQEQIRSYLMGWKDGSGTATRYNRRFVEKKAREAGLSLQEKSATRIPGVRND